MPRVPESAKGMERKALKKTLNDMARELVFRRDGFKCWRADELPHFRHAQLQPAHIHSRRKESMCWDLANIMTLCGGCHMWWHQNPEDAFVWLRGRLGDKAVDWLGLRYHAPSHDLDLQAVFVYLKGQLERTSR
jgi:hypothetical protein